MIVERVLGYLAAGIFAALIAYWGYSLVKRAGYNEAVENYREAFEDANRKIREAERERDELADRIAKQSRDEARETTQETARDTAAAIERVRTVIQRVEIPGNCPESLPREVNDEGQRAVDRANGVRRG